MSEPLTPELLLSAYAQGCFPMADDRHGEELSWYSPEERGILPLESFHIPTKLARLMRKCPYRVTVDTAFADVIHACADTPRGPDNGTWINDTIIDAYTKLHEQGHAHSIECWQGDKLVGGLYGVSIGGAFCGESMFSTADNASKIALVSLVGVLKEAGYTLLDTQFVNDHLKQFGVRAITEGDYLERLSKALNISPSPSSRFATVAGTMLSAESFPANVISPSSTLSRS